jgi:hypothetical protein
VGTPSRQRESRPAAESSSGNAQGNLALAREALARAAQRLAGLHAREGFAVAPALLQGVEARAQRR